jgi:hypothetical protein
MDVRVRDGKVQDDEEAGRNDLEPQGDPPRVVRVDEGAAVGDPVGSDLGTTERRGRPGSMTAREGEMSW